MENGKDNHTCAQLPYHPWDPKIVAVVDRWALFIGSIYYKN